MREQFRRRDLPHWDVPTAAYFVTSCLEGSIPARGLLDIYNYRDELAQRPRPSDKTASEWELEQAKRVFARRDRWLDDEPAVRHLQDPHLAEIVVNALYHFAGERYDLLAYVVMPSHLHWVFQPRDAWVKSLVVEAQPEAASWKLAATDRSARERIVHSINRHTAAECNKLLGRSGTFWQHESYDHWVRGCEELERIMLYVEANPVKARHVASPEDWRFSSARDRIAKKLQFGEPLRR